MRILYVLAPGEPESVGGIQSYQRGVVDGMRSRNHEVKVLTIRPAEILSAAREWLPRRGYLHPQFFWRGAYYQDFRFHQAVERMVADASVRFCPDVVHVFHLHELGALRGARAPSIVTCHGMEVGKTHLAEQSFRTATAIHCNSQFTCGLVHAVYPEAQRRKVLRWGVQTRTIEPGPHRFHLITVARLVERKNLATVLQALRSRPRLRYAIVGDGPIRAELEQLARRLDLDSVEFFGEVDEAQKWQLLSCSRAFILPPRNDLGRDVEGLGLCFYEAFSVGLPVIGAESGGVAEAVGKGGIVVADPLDPEEIGRAIDALLDPATHAQWRERALQRVDEEKWEDFLDGFEEFYGEVASAARS